MHQCVSLILRAFWAHTLAFQRALLNFQGLRALLGPWSEIYKGPHKCLQAQRNYLHLKAYKINAFKNISDKQCINVYPEFLRGFWAQTLPFQRALINFQGLRAQGPFLFETLVINAFMVKQYVHALY